MGMDRYMMNRQMVWTDAASWPPCEIIITDQGMVSGFQLISSAAIPVPATRPPKAKVGQTAAVAWFWLVAALLRLATTVNCCASPSLSLPLPTERGCGSLYKSAGQFIQARFEDVVGELITSSASG